MQNQLQQWVQLRALLDTGSDLNVVSRLLSKELDLQKDTDVIMPSAGYLNGMRFALHSAVTIPARVRDRTGTVAKALHTFFEAQLSGFDIILGMPWLWYYNPMIHIRERNIK